VPIETAARGDNAGTTVLPEYTARAASSRRLGGGREPAQNGAELRTTQFRVVRNIPGAARPRVATMRSDVSAELTGVSTAVLRDLLLAMLARQ